PLDCILGHIGRAKDATQHQIMDIDAEGLLGRRNSLPCIDWNAGSIEDGERAHAVGLPMTHALDGVVDGGVDMLSDQIDAHLATAFERNVCELEPESLL